MYGENQKDMNIFNTETRTDPTILKKKEFKFKLQNELYISESLITKLTKEKDELLKGLSKHKDSGREDSHPLFESRLECLHSELQQAHEVKRDIEKQLNILEYELSHLQFERSFKSMECPSRTPDYSETTRDTLPFHEKKECSRTVREVPGLRKQKIEVLADSGSNSAKEVTFPVPSFRRSFKIHKRLNEDLELRMKSAAELKASIDDSKIIMAIIQAKQKANQNAMLLEEKALSIQAQQNQKDEKLELALHRRIAKIEAHQAAFKESQKRKHKEIIAKLLNEELLQEEKLKRLPFLCEQSERYKYSKYSERSEKPSELEQNMIDELLLQQQQQEKGGTVTKSVVNTFPTEVEPDDDGDDDDSENEKRLTLSHDSLHGLWDLSKKSQNIVTEENVDNALLSFVARDTVKASVTDKETVSTSLSMRNLTSRSPTKLSDMDKTTEVKDKGLLRSTMYFSERNSKADKEILQRVLQQTRENIIQPQIVTGRRFDGPSFTAKPAEIWFKNIEVGRMHKTKIILTNASYAISTCRYVGITSTLMDFVEVKFNPPGSLSPGMNCGVKIKFTPKMNKNLNGELEFLSPTGSFFIPFKATVKKCEFSTDCNTVDFGEVVIGETVQQSITLINSGAKGANFTFKTLSEIHKEENEVNVLETSPETIRAEESIEDSVNSGETRKHNENEESDPQKQENENSVPQIEEYEENTRLEEENEMKNILTNFKAGELNRGFLAPFSTVKLDIIWSPKDISINEGECLMEQEKFVISFDDAESSDIYIQAIGYAKNIPVWLSTSSLSLGICWYDRLYQECFSIHNRTKSAVKVVFEVDKEISDHLKILPKTGFVQAESRLLAQVKLLPKLSLPDDLALLQSDVNGSPLGGTQTNEEKNRSLSFKLSFDPQTGILQAPVTVNVIGQTNKLQLMIDAVITTTDLSLWPNPINFGWTEIHETVISRLSITNHSLLPQNFGIVEIPEFVEVQPNDGFGVILGKETIELDVLFRPKKAKEYNFNLVCKSGIGRTFTTVCQGIGVYSPLSLSTNQLKLNPTPISESSLISLKITNHHTSSNPYTHVQPCIGSDTRPVSVGPRAFELQIVKATITNPYGLITDDDLANNQLESVLSTFIDFYPATGTLNPGESQQINIRFSPYLNKLCIQKEASRLCDLNEEKRKRDELLLLSLEEDKTTAKSNKPTPKASQNAVVKKDKMTDRKPVKPSDEKPPLETETTFLPNDPKSILEGSEKYTDGLNSLLIHYPNPPPVFNNSRLELKKDEVDQQHSTVKNKLSLIKLGEYDWPGVFLVYRVACFVAEGPGSETAAKPSPTYRKENTLFFELLCPIIRPPLLVLSNKSYNRLNFGAICAGQSNTRTLSVKNISPYCIQLKPKPLNPIGAFEIISFNENISSGEVCNLNFAFTPNSLQTHCTETFILQSYPIKNKMSAGVSSSEYCPLSVRFSGICVTPKVEVTGPPELITIPCGSQNPENSNIPVNTKQTLHYLRFGYILLGEFIERLITLTNPTNITLNFEILYDDNQIGGTKNQNGLPVFMVVPNKGKIKPGENQVVSITFAPDHESETYQQTFLITLHSQIKNSHKLILSGACKQHNLYIRGGDQQDIASSTLNTNVQNDFLGVQFLPESKEIKTSYLTINGQQSSLLRENSNITAENEPSEKEGEDNPMHKKELKIKESPTKRILYAGFVQSSSGGSKKSGECIIENLNELSAIGFTVNPPKLILDPGTEQPITFTWTPNPDVRTGAIVKSTALIQLRSDVTINHHVMLRGIL